MFVFGFILYIFFVVLLAVSALAYLSPILIGLGILIIANAVSAFHRGKMAPALWNIVTVVVITLATGLLWKDIMDEAFATGPLPFVILAIYGVVSFAVLATPEQNRKTKEHKKFVALEELPEKRQKRIRVSRVVAIICTVMTGIGAIIVATESADIGESLPPTILFAIIAIVCWGIAGKRH